MHNAFSNSQLRFVVKQVLILSSHTINVNRFDLCGCSLDLATRVLHGPGIHNLLAHETASLRFKLTSLTIHAVLCVEDVGGFEASRSSSRSDI